MSNVVVVVIVFQVGCVAIAPAKGKWRYPIFVPYFVTATEHARILKQVKDWFRQTIVANHVGNTRKLADPGEFNINPFLAPYLAAFLAGGLSSEAVARALVYPRVLGTSITTSFGTNMQNFISDVLKNSFGSMVAGIDIEFVDTVDGRRKYCQVKLGPNTINRDDVASIHGHFKAARNLGKTNKVQLAHGDLVVGILYGEPGEESGHYRKLRDDHDYPLYIGADFWHRLTGHPPFYDELRHSIAEVAAEANGAELVEEVIAALAQTVEVKRLAGEDI